MIMDYKTAEPQRNPYLVAEQKKNGEFLGHALVDLILLDVFADVCSRTLLFSFNYVFITYHMMWMFLEFEDRFRKARHPLYVHKYEHPTPQLCTQKLAALVIAAMQAEDEEALKMFAAEFERLRLGALVCIYWGYLREEESGLKRRRINDEDDFPTDQCTVCKEHRIHPGLIEGE